MVVSEVISVAEMEFLISQKLTYNEISDRLKAESPLMRGLSPMNIRRFCTKHNIGKKCTLSDRDIRKEILQCTQEVRV